MSKRITAKSLAADLGHFNEKSVTTLKSVINPDGSVDHDEMMDLRLCGEGDDSFFEWITEYGDPIGDIADEIDNSELKDSHYKIVRLVVQAWATSEYGDGPDFAVIRINKEFIERVRSLVKVCNDHKLSEVRMYDQPETWGPGNVGDELRLQCAEMIVEAGGNVLFTDYPKHSSYKIESQIISLEDIERIFKSEEHGFSFHNEEIRTRYLETDGLSEEITEEN